MDEKQKQGGRPRKYDSTPLGDWVASHWKSTRAELAAELHIGEYHLETLIRGSEKPGLALARRIKRLSEGTLTLDALLDFDTDKSTARAA